MPSQINAQRTRTFQKLNRIYSIRDKQISQLCPKFKTDTFKQSSEIDKMETLMQTNCTPCHHQLQKYGENCQQMVTTNVSMNGECTITGCVHVNKMINCEIDGCRGLSIYRAYAMNVK